MRRNSLIGLAATAIMAVAIIVATNIFGNALVRTRGGEEMIRVTGSARKPIRSDFIIWSGTVAYRANDIPSAYRSVKEGTAKVVAYLRAKGIPENEIVTSSITTIAQYAQVRSREGGADGEQTTSQRIDGYELSQQVEVRSANVDLVSKVSREATDLISSGVSFQSNSPQFLYTKISDVKVEILAEAAKDARRRAEEIARSSGARLGTVRFARMSPLQITPLYSNEISSEGLNDTSSLDKAITAIVTMGFGVN